VYKRQLLYTAMLQRNYPIEIQLAKQEMLHFSQRYMPMPLECC